MIFTIHKTFLLHKNTRFTKFSKFYTVHVIPSDPTVIRVCWMRERGLNHFGFRVKKPHKQVCKATPSPSPALGPSGASPEKGRPVCVRCSGAMWPNAHFDTEPAGMCCFGERD